VKTGISSFTIALNLHSGTALPFTNNGLSYPLSDAVMLMRPQSCLLQHTGASSFTAAIRNDRAHLPAALVVSYKLPRPGLPVPALRTATVPMIRGRCVGLYTLYTAEWTIPGGLSYASKIDVVSGEGDDVVVDDFNDAAELPGSCAAFRDGGGVCESYVLPTSSAVGDVATAMTTTRMPGMITGTAVATATAETSALPQPSHHDGAGKAEEAVRLGDAFAGFFEYLTNYFVNFFFG